MMHFPILLCDANHMFFFLEQKLSVSWVLVHIERRLGSTSLNWLFDFVAGGTSGAPKLGDLNVQAASEDADDGIEWEEG